MDEVLAAWPRSKFEVRSMLGGRPRRGMDPGGRGRVIGVYIFLQYELVSSGGSVDSVGSARCEVVSEL